MNDEAETKLLIRQNSHDTWICSKCSFQNLKLLPECQICQSPKPKSSQDLIRSDKNQEQGFKCFSCGHVSSLLTSKCGKCGVVLIPEDSDEEDRPIKKTDKKVEKPSLIECKNCAFENDRTNEYCVACENSLAEIGALPARIYARPYSHKYSQQKCQFCPMILKKKFIKNHMLICPGKINSTVGFEDIRRKYCTFCYEKFDAEIAVAHDETCLQRKKFFETKDNPTFDRMTKLQIDTITYMHKKSEKLHWLSERSLVQRVQKLGYSARDLQDLHHYIVNYAPIIIHMHANNHMQFFVKDTHYRNQFQTRKSSGSLSSSSRISWEDRMFDSRHHDATPFQRVKYGTINFTNDPKGVNVCSGYGQSYFLLKPHVRNRCTVTDMDSSSPSAAIGTFQFCYQVFNKVTDGEIRAAFEGMKGKQVGSQVIGSYKQIQIHGPVQFKKDIERVYISKQQLTDPSIQKMVKEFCKNNQLEYQIFQKVIPGSMGLFGGVPHTSFLPILKAPAPSLFSRKPKKTKATAHLFGGGSSRPYFSDGYKRYQPPARIIPDPPKMQPARVQPPRPIVQPSHIIRDVPIYQDEYYQEQDIDYQEDYFEDYLDVPAPQVPPPIAPQIPDAASQVDGSEEEAEQQKDQGVEGVDYI